MEDELGRACRHEWGKGEGIWDIGEKAGRKETTKKTKT
jgi:hypothetical protein